MGQERPCKKQLWQYLTACVTTACHRKTARENCRVSARSKAPMRAGNLQDKTPKKRAAQLSAGRGQEKPGGRDHGELGGEMSTPAASPAQPDGRDRASGAHRGASPTPRGPAAHPAPLWPASRAAQQDKKNPPEAAITYLMG